LVIHFGAAAGCLVSGGVLSFVAPLIGLIGRGHESPTVREHAKAALNFFLPVAGVALALVVLLACSGVDQSVFGGAIRTLLGLVAAAVWIVGMVFGILAGLQANDGRLFKYPWNVQIVK
jgi:uncharacterized Tic20 family protein